MPLWNIAATAKSKWHKRTTMEESCRTAAACNLTASIYSFPYLLSDFWLSSQPRQFLVRLCGSKTALARHRA
jgi:hypothetical protein